MAQALRAVEDETPQTALVAQVSANPGLVLLDRERFDQFYEAIKAETDKLVPDLTTEKGRKEIASMAFKVAKTKTAIDAAGKLLNEEARAKINIVDAARRDIRDKLDALKDEVRRPLTEWEAREEERIAACDALIERMKAAAVVSLEDTAETVAQRLAKVKAFALDEGQFQSSLPLATAQQEAAVQALTAAQARLVKEEADRAELERLRAEAAEREARERAEAEAKAAAEAAERQRQEAEARAARAAEEEQARIDGHVERSLIWKDEETGIWLKSRPDVIPNSSGDYADLKTTVSVATKALEQSLSSYDYPMQGALVGMASEAVLGIPMQSFTLVWVEKTAPFCVRVTTLTPDDLERGRMQVRSALRTMARCLDSGEWPGPGAQHDAEYLSLPAYAAKRIDEELEIQAASANDNHAQHEAA